MSQTRCAVIAGAGSGTGAEVGKRLAREGWPVVLARRNRDALDDLVGEIEAGGGRALAVGADAGDEDQVAALFDQAEQAFGAPQIVISTTAGFLSADVVDTEVEDFDALWRDCARSGFLIGRESARRMLPRGDGTILFVGATASVKQNAGFAAFAAAKHGLRAIAGSLAREVGPKGIHVAHIVVDGIIDVPRVQAEMPELAAAKGPGGLIDPGSIAETLLWLHRQPRDAWTFELDLRAFAEPW